MQTKLLYPLFFLCGYFHAQINLTKNANEPIETEWYYSWLYDTVSSIPRHSGQNQVWDYSFMHRIPGYNYTVKYFPVSSVFQLNTVFPTADLVGTNIDVSYPFCYNLEADHLEWQGFYGVETCIYSDPLIVMKWPFSYGNSFVDTYSGVMLYNPFLPPGSTGTISGSYTCSASGTGTLILPEGIVLDDVMQVTTVRTFSVHYASYDSTETVTRRSFYHGNFRYPVLFENTETRGTYVQIQSALALGISESKVYELNIYPNPSRNNCLVQLSPNLVNNGSIKVFSMNGELLKIILVSGTTESLYIGDLSPGLYILEAGNRNGHLIKKLVVQ